MAKSSGLKYSRSFVFAATGFLFILFLILWYKQYTCFNYGEGGLYMDRLKLAVFGTMGAIALICIFGAFNSLGALRDGRSGAAGTLFFFAAIWTLGAVITGEREDISYLNVAFSFVAVYSAIGCVILTTDDKKGDKSIPDILFIAALITGIAMTLFFLMLSIKDKTLLSYVFGGKYSLTRIAGFSCCFGLSVLGLLIFGGKKLPAQVSEGLRGAVCSGYFVPSSVLIIICLLKGQFSYYFEGSSLVLKLICTAAVFAALFKGRKYLLKEVKFPAFVWPVYYGLITALTFCEHCVVNFWGGEVGDLRHTGIYYRPLYVVSKFLPFGGKNMDIYGHYALFYKPFMMIFGYNTTTAGVITGVTAAVSMIFILLIMHKLIKSDILKFLGGILLVSALALPWLYLQNFPCRFLFPAMIMYLITIKDMSKAESGKKDLSRIAGYLLCMLAILWNPETGAVCAAVFSVYAVLKNGEGKGLKQLIIAMLKELPVMALEAGIAYGIVAVYNLLAESFGPGAEGVFSKSSEVFIVDHVTTGSNGVLRWGNDPWLYIMILFMILTAAVLYKTGILNKGGKLSCKGSERIYISGLLISLGYFVYWMTRPEEYAIIAAPLALIILMLYEKVFSREGNLWMSAGIIVTMGLTAYTLSIPQAADSISTKLIDNSVMSAAAIEEDIKNFEAEVPRDCYGYTYGLPMLYMQFGWDINFDRYVSIDDQEHLISDDPSLELEGMELSKNINVGRQTYYLYERVR